MHLYTATITWDRGEADFADGLYSRSHRWTFAGGTFVEASASPTVVPVPYSDPACVDPEQALVASAASCHMLWFLDLARRAGYVIDSYEDAAEGQMTEAPEGGEWISQIDLRPKIAFRGSAPDADELAQLHHAAHDQCYIAKSLKTRIVTHPER